MRRPRDPRPGEAFEVGDPFDAEGGEYDVIHLRINPATVSLVCFAVAFVLGLMTRYAHWWWVLGYGRWVRIGFYGSLATAVFGLGLGLWSARRPERRLLGVVASAANGTVVLLEVLFLVLFRWIARFSL